ncbi:MAG: CapA family protein [Treponema sp.]|jgi:poly-gamma-glutamate synthesis protein (capsule biosynthesis protein)|nr:CapA family protein [Treponema sp.]
MKNSLIFLAASIFYIFSCQSLPIPSEKDKPENETSNTVQNDTLTLIAAGDNLFHETVLISSLTDGVYDFSPIYTEIKSIAQNADIAFINQETVMAGERFGYSGYPAFNTPQSLARNLVDAGFDIFNLANNHAMDKGASGLYATLDFLDTLEITVIGARRSGDSARIVTKNNIKLGLLSYTFSLNGIPLPRDNPNLVSMIDRNKMEQEINALRPLCDFLIVSMHWGDEYQLEPNREQTSLATFLAEHNVDLIIGHHPHVLQKTETITLPDGRKTLCFYSLGNFASHQRERERIIGGIAVITFTRDASSGALSISDHGMIPVICHFDRNLRNTKIYPLYSYTEELLENHALKNSGAGLTMNFFYSVTNRLNTRIIMHNPFIH